MLTNWKTTVHAIVAAFFAFVLFSPDLFAGWPWLIAIAKFGFVGGLVAFGLSSKDFNVPNKPAVLACMLLLAGHAFAQVAPHAMLPDPKLTPGALDPRVTQATIQETICKPGYTRTVRNVPESVKREVMERYGLPLSDLSKVEIDHFDSLEYGGSNDIANLWPQYYDPAPGQTGYLGAREKDVVETHLKRQVCSGAMTLAQAQDAAHHWPDVYRQLKGEK